jgi:hypothetical protein
VRHSAIGTMPGSDFWRAGSARSVSSGFRSARSFRESSGELPLPIGPVAGVTLPPPSSINGRRVRSRAANSGKLSASEPARNIDRGRARGQATDRTPGRPLHISRGWARGCPHDPPLGFAKPANGFEDRGSTVQDCTSLSAGVRLMACRFRDRPPLCTVVRHVGCLLGCHRA